MSPNPVTDRMDRLAQAIAERVVNLVVQAVDVDRLLERVDVNALVQRVDVNSLIQRVDVNALVDHLDVDAIVEKLDIDALVSHTELGSIIAKSTTSVMTEVLDLIRAQGVGLDDFLSRWTNRILRRSPDSLPAGPALLLAAGSTDAGQTRRDNPIVAGAAPDAGRAPVAGAAPDTGAGSIAPKGTGARQ